MRIGRRQGAVVAVGVLAALAAVVAIGAASVQRERGSPSAGSGAAGGRGHLMQASIPAQIDERPHGFVSSDVVRPLVNAWRASTRRELTEVSAGSLARDRSTGALAIFRHEFGSARQGVDLVEVRGSGPLRITDAPLGRGVEASAQRSGRIEFVGGRGIRGTLRLSDDRVRLDEG